MQTVVGVKFKQSGKTYYFNPNGLELKIGNKVIVETIRGREIATITFANKEMDLTNFDEEISNVVSLASKSDLEKHEENLKKAPKVVKLTKELISKYNLNMKLVDVDFTLDGAKVIINFVCEDRVDFRDLVRDLANELKLRIELRQIGIRDQAKIIGAIGGCGQVCCCKRYLSDFDKVSIKMAKNQNLSLNPTKISGVCGRLMCCLAYENDNYTNVFNKAPKINSVIKTPAGEGTVVYVDVFNETVTIKLTGEDSKIVSYPINELKFKKPNDITKSNQAKEDKIKPDKNKKFNKQNEKAKQENKPKTEFEKLLNSSKNVVNIENQDKKDSFVSKKKKFNKLKKNTRK